MKFHTDREFLAWDEVLLVEGQQTDHMRTIFFGMSLGIGVMALSQYHQSPLMMGAATLLVLGTIVYGFYIVATTSKKLHEKALNYSRFRTVYAYYSLILLFIIFCGLLLRTDVDEMLKAFRPKSAQETSVAIPTAPVAAPALV